MAFPGCTARLLQRRTDFSAKRSFCALVTAAIPCLAGARPVRADLTCGSLGTTPPRTHHAKQSARLRAPQVFERVRVPRLPDVALKIAVWVNATVRREVLRPPGGRRRRRSG